MVEKILFGLVCICAVCSAIIFYLYGQMSDDCIRLEKEVIEYRKQEELRKNGEAGKALSLAFLNRNPLNVKAVSGGWEGQIGVDGQGHAIFKSWEHGMRAASIVLKNYAKRHRIDTISDVIDRFAEGNRQQYKDFVAKKLGVKSDAKINIIQRMPELLRAMARFESGSDLPEVLFVPYDILARLYNSSTESQKRPSWASLCDFFSHYN